MPNEPVELIFAGYAETDEELRHTALLAESIRAFAGRFSEAPIRVYLPDRVLTGLDLATRRQFDDLRVDLRTSCLPDDAAWFYYAGKTFAAGAAERDALGAADILVWMDEDTLVLQEPTDFALTEGIDLAYRPVMHNRTGSLYSEPPDLFWSLVYEKLELGPHDLFPMVTPADRRTIRAYFNAGLIVVRPEESVLQRWGECFERLYRDSALADMCREDTEKRIFLHQTALVGGVLNILGRDALTELSEWYNYPMFFKRMYGAEKEFDRIDEVVTLRYDIYFRKPETDWSDKLRGPAELISLMKAHLDPA